MQPSANSSGRTLGCAAGTQPTKQSEVGEIPESWRVVRLGEISEQLRSGVTPKGGEKVYLKTGIPLIRSQNVLMNQLSLRDVAFISPDVHESMIGSAVQPGDVLLNITGASIGRVTFVPEELKVANVNQHVCRIRLSKGTDPAFLSYYLSTPQGQAQIMGSQFGTTRQGLNYGNVRSIRIPLPRFEEQRAIARTLDAVQEAREARQRELALERERRAAFMEYLFTQGTRGEPTKQTEIGTIPESWQAIKIDAIIRLKQYGLSLRGNGTGSVPILRMNNLAEGKVDLTNLQWVDLDVRTQSAFVLRPGDVLFNRTNSQDLVGKVGLFDHNGTYVFASYLVRLTFNETVAASPFVNAYLNLASTQRRLKGIASRGVSQSNISAGKLGSFLVPLPALDEQREIAAVSDAFDRRINSLAREEAKLGEMFRAILDDLMTGKLSALPLTQENQIQ